jgi:DUF2924 family protein
VPASRTIWWPDAKNKNGLEAVRLRFGKRTLTPGTVLTREWDRRSQRVMVMADGFAWNGQTYDSLSKVAYAITGTKWNGPRFFGLRDKEDRAGGGACLIRSLTRWTPNTMPRQPI